MTRLDCMEEPIMVHPLYRSNFKKAISSNLDFEFKKLVLHDWKPLDFLHESYKGPMDAWHETVAEVEVLQ